MKKLTTALFIAASVFTGVAFATDRGPVLPNITAVSSGEMFAGVNVYAGPNQHETQTTVATFNSGVSASLGRTSLTIMVCCGI